MCTKMTKHLQMNKIHILNKHNPVATLAPNVDSKEQVQRITFLRTSYDKARIISAIMLIVFKKMTIFS